MCNSVNATLATLGREPLADEVDRRLHRRRRVMLVRRALLRHADGGRRWTRICWPRAYEFFLDYYRAHKLDFTYAYDGVLEALAALRQLA